MPHQRELYRVSNAPYYAYLFLRDRLEHETHFYRAARLVDVRSAEPNTSPGVEAASMDDREFPSSKECARSRMQALS